MMLVHGRDHCRYGVLLVACTVLSLCVFTRISEAGIPTYRPVSGDLSSAVVGTNGLEFVWEGTTNSDIDVVRAWFVVRGERVPATGSLGSHPAGTAVRWSAQISNPESGFGAATLVVITKSNGIERIGRIPTYLEFGKDKPRKLSPEEYFSKRETEPFRIPTANIAYEEKSANGTAAVNFTLSINTTTYQTLPYDQVSTRVLPRAMVQIASQVEGATGWFIRDTDDLDDDGSYTSPTWSQDLPCSVRVRIYSTAESSANRNVEVLQESGAAHGVEWSTWVTSADAVIIPEFQIPTTAGDGWEALAYYGAIQDAWEFMDQEANEDVGSVDIIFPKLYADGAWYFCGPQEIHLEDTGGTGWSRDTLHHEYGHHVQCREYGSIAGCSFTQPPGCGPTDPTDHWASMRSCPEFAFAEGFAKFFEALIDNEPSNATDWCDGGNIESNVWFDYDGNDSDGCITEGSVASILWDLMDSGSETGDGFSMGISDLYNDIIEDYEPETAAALAAAVIDQTNNVTATTTLFNRYGCDVCDEFAVPDDPVLVSPVNGAVNQPVSGTLNWNDVPDADHYQVEINTVCGGGTVLNSGGSQAGYSGLAEGTTYHWRVRAANICGQWGNWSGCFTFTTTAPQPVCTITNIDLDLFSIDWGATAIGGFTIANTGGGTLSGTITGSGDPFNNVDPDSYNLGPGQTQDFDVSAVNELACVENFTVHVGSTCGDLPGTITMDGIDQVWVFPIPGLVVEANDIGQTGSNTLQVANQGCRDEPITFTIIQSGSEFSMDQSTYTVGPLGGIDVPVYYTPSGSDPVQASVNWGGPNTGGGTIPLTGQLRNPIRYVSPAGDDGNPGTIDEPFLTIQHAIDVALPGDEIRVLAGTYNGPGNVNLDMLGKPITLRSVDGPANTTIDGGGGGTGFTMFDSGEDSTTIIEGFTIVEVATGVSLTASAPKLRNLVFPATVGTGVLYDNGFGGPWPLVIESCDFTGNGLGVYSYTGGDICQVRGSTFTDNTTAVQGSVTLYGCVISGGSSAATSTDDGSMLALYNTEISGVVGTVFALDPNDAVSVRAFNCNIHDNTGAIGGGWSEFDEYITLEFTNCDLVNNGGGIAATIEGRNRIVLDGCLYAGNAGGISFGGGNPSNLIIRNSTLADGAANAIYSDNYLGASIEITNSIVSGFAGNGLEVFDNSGTVTVQCSDFHGNGGQNFVGIPDQVGLNDNISEDPLFCDRDNGDYTLAANSPCAEENNVACEQIGDLPIGCGAIDIHNWYVAVDGDDGASGRSGEPFATIQHAIDQALSGDTINLADGTYTGIGNRDLETRGKDLVVTATDGDPTLCIIDCGSTEVDPHTALWVHEGGQFILEHVGIIGARTVTSHPGAIYVEGQSIDVPPSGLETPDGLGGHLTMRNCRITGTIGNGLVSLGDGQLTLETTTVETSTSVGLVWDAFTTGTATACHFDRNFGDGAQIYCAEGNDSAFTDCTFSDNEGSGATGSYYTGVFATFTDCHFDDNTGDGYYGGIWGTMRRCTALRNGNKGMEIYADGWLWMYECDISENGSDGLACGTGSTIEDSRFIHNGGYGLYPGFYSTLTNLVVARNTNAGIYAPWEPDLDITNTTITRNGVGIEATSTDAFILQTTIVTDNTGYGLDFGHVAGTYIILDCDVWNNGTDMGPFVPFLPEDGNISADPDFCDPDADDYTLRDLSPCAPDNHGGVLIGAEAVACSGQPTVYVAPGGDDGGGGGSGDPYATIQYAIDVTPAGGQIILAEGEYTETLTITHGLAIREAEGDSAIIRAPADHRVVTITTASDTVRFEGITLTGGRPTQGAQAGHDPGGALLSIGTPVVLEDCHITDNVIPLDPATNSGGAVHVREGAYLRMVDCVVDHNVAPRAAGIVVRSAVGADLYHNLIVHNAAETHASGLWILPTPAVTTAPYRLVGNTIAYNTINYVVTEGDSIGYGARFSYPDQVELSKNAIAENSGVGSQIGFYDVTTTTMDCNVVAPAPEYYSTGTYDAVANIHVPPFFCDPDAMDFHVASDSPCVTECDAIGFFGEGCAEVSGAEEPEEALPTAYRLVGAYPNPFNPMTKLVYELPRASTVNLRIYDLRGRLVRTLVTREMQNPGRHETVWKGKDDRGRSMSSGVYFYRIEADGFTDTKRMMLLK